MKRPPIAKGKKLKHRYEQTDVQCLLRRVGPDGTTYYGRVKRNGKVWLKKLGDEFQAAKRALRIWLNCVDEKAAAAAEADAEAKDMSTWGHFADRYLRDTDRDLSLAPKSKQYRRECVHRIKKIWKAATNGDDLEKRKVTTLTQDHCADWAGSITGYYYPTYDNTVGVFKRILQDAVDAGHLLTNPARKLRRLGKRRLALARHGETGHALTDDERTALELPEDGEGPRWFPSPEEFSKIVKQMRSYKFGPTQAAAEFAELLCFTGCRLSEARRLRWSDVEWPKSRLRINGAKATESDNEYVRYVPITESLAKLLKRLEKRPHELTDKLARVTECRGTMQRACKDLNLPRRLDHHDLRHRFATRAVAAGVPVPIVSDWLGRRDGGALLLKTYRHEDAAESQRLAKKVVL